MVQLDLMPTGPLDEHCANRREDDPFDPECDFPGAGEPTRDPTLTFGLRVAERPAVYTWLGTAAIGLLALIFKDTDFGCC